MVKIIYKILIFSFIFLCFTETLRAQTTAPIKILLVPGHDNEVWGAQYGNIKEADMNLELATQIYNLLKKDKRFDVYITRDSGGYTKEFSDYFSLHKDEILLFEESAKKAMDSKITDGSFIQKENVPHHTVSEDIALRLYGFSKWADENKIDAIIHIHFDDYPRPNSWRMGKYRGFTVYIPDGQLANSKESGQLGADIFTQLHKKYITSTYPPEAGGLVPDQKLIALGANDTLNASVRSVLVEYGYIYRFGNSVLRHKAYIDMANFTAGGIKNYFFGK